MQLMRRELQADEEDANEGSSVFVERRCLIKAAMAQSDLCRVKPAAKEMRLSRRRYRHAGQTVIASLTYDVIALPTDGDYDFFLTGLMLFLPPPHQ